MFTRVQVRLVIIAKSKFSRSVETYSHFVNAEPPFTMTLPSASSARPTICNRPCDVCSIRWSPLLPFLPPCLGSSEKDQDEARCYLPSSVCRLSKRKTVGARRTP